MSALPHERYRHYLETLTPETLERLSDYVTPDVRFADPFNDVRGPVAMAAVFRDMFESVGDVRFTIRHMHTDRNHCLMAWTFAATLFGKPWHFDGTSEVEFAEDGRVAAHIDHWDAARAVAGYWLAARENSRPAENRLIELFAACFDICSLAKNSVTSPISNPNLLTRARFTSTPDGCRNIQSLK